MREAAMGVEGVIKDPPPKVYVTGLGSYSIKLLMYVKASSYKMEWSVPDRIYREVLRRFAEEGIEIPYPVTTVQLKRDVPPDTVASMAAIRQAEK
jgi:MscS family membrane protein